MTTSEGSVILSEDEDEDVDVVVQPHASTKAITKNPSINANFFMIKNIRRLNKIFSLIAFAFDEMIAAWKGVLIYIKIYMVLA